MKNYRFFFVRHGTTDWNAGMIPLGSLNLPLNNIGTQEAHNAAVKLKELLGFNFRDALILSSTLVRAEQTAKIISDLLEKAPIQFSTLLTERYYGDYKAQKHSVGTLSDAEDIFDFNSRARKAFDYVVSELELNQDNNLIVVSHYGIFERFLIELNLDKYNLYRGKVAAFNIGEDSNSVEYY